VGGGRNGGQSENINLYLLSAENIERTANFILK
jgi:hypothetical protein